MESTYSSPQQALRRLLSAIPIVPMLLCALLGNAGMLMLLVHDGPIPQEAYRPLETSAVLQCIIVMSLLNGACLTLTLLLLRLVGRGSFFRILSACLLMTLNITLLATTQYYIYFGGFPSTEVFREFLDNPLVTSGYASSALGMHDYWYVSLFSLFLFLPCALIIRGIERQARPLVSIVIMSLSLAALLMTTAQQLRRTENSIPMGMASQNMSLPIKFWSEFLQSNKRNTVELASRYLPSFAKNDTPQSLKRPTNLIVFLVDCGRADHFPFYGYERNTFPNLYAHKDDWIVYSQFYAHGPTTSVSIPVLLNSNYTAGIHRQGMNARYFWKSLKDQGYRTAYFNSATLKWGNIEGLAGVDLLDAYFTADHDQDDRIVISNTAYDFNIRDAKLFSKYSQFLESAQAQNTMAFVHFNATHFPYHSEDGYNLFTPYLDPEEVRLGREQVAAEKNTQKILNSYDNSLVYVDHLIQQYIELLRDKGVLESSVLMVIADHGEAFREHGHLFHNTGIYNELVKVPLLIRVGDELPEVEQKLMQSRNSVGGLVDVIPTVASVLHAKRPKSYQGRSLLVDEAKPYELIFYKFLIEEFAVINQHRKFFYSLNTKQAHYFDLAQDPQEMRNLWIKPVPDFQTFLDVLEQRQIIHSN
ncbi:MAG: sulfatase-like hydrolase/transferase [Bdellovibrionales bacterium]|nr:sulfatase-like hydrolase/transferase [Bdellovibrionales bacterium]